VEFQKATRTKIKVVLYGEAYEMRKPKLREKHEYIGKLSDMTNDQAYDCTLEFLSLLGLPKDVAEDMEEEHFMELSRTVLGVAKK